MEKTNEILTIAGERVEVRYESDFYEACGKCCFHNIFVRCNVRTLCKGCPCEKYSDHENRRFAYFVEAEYPQEKDDKEFCKDNCKGYQETGRCFADGDCKARQEAESKASVVSETDFDAEYKRYMESRKDDVSGHAVTVNIKDLARHFAEWERKRTLDKVVEWMKKNLTYIHPRKGVETCMVNIPAFLDAMNEENI